MASGITRRDMDEWGDRFKADLKDLIQAETSGIHQKVDGIYNQRHEDRELQKEVCRAHAARLDAVEKNVGTWLTFRQRLVGAWGAAKFATKVGAPVFGALWAGLKWYASHSISKGGPTP